MLFTSFEFVFLVFITLGVYYLPWVRKYQVLLLVISSLTFYGWNKPYLLILLIFSILVNGLGAWLVYTAKTDFRKKIILATGITIDLGILIFFKYSKIIIDSYITQLENLSHVEKVIYYLPLPLGISFFTFQGISLLIDVSRNPQRVRQWGEESFFKFLLKTAVFQSFFPQLISGPIAKSYQFYPQISLKSWRDIQIEPAFRMLLIGYFLKIVVADNLKEHLLFISYPEFLNYPTLDLIIMIFGYSMQIFSDFAGYSLIAIGVASLFGYRLLNNFLFPFISQSISEFWQRWHISLTSWFREYIFFPLNIAWRDYGMKATLLAILITFFLSGIWHGAAQNFIFFGLFHGIAIAIEQFFYRNKKWLDYKIISVLKVVLVFSGVSLSMLLIRLPEFSEFIIYLQCIKNNMDVPFYWNYRNFYVLLYSIPVILYHLNYLAPNEWKLKFIIPVKPYILGCMLFLIITNGGIPGSFIYFRF